MNQQKSKLPTSRISGMYRQWALISFVLSSLAASLTFTLAYNAKTGYIADTTVSIILIAIVFLELAISALVARSAPIYINEGNCTALTRVTTLMLHIAVIICGVMAAVGFKNAIFSIDAIKRAGGSSLLPSHLLKGLLMAVSATVFLSSPSLYKSKKNCLLASQINGYSTVIFCVIGIALVYFDMSVEMNNPQKLYLQFALASICLATLYDMKSYVQGSGKRLSLYFKLSSISLAPIATISTFIAFAEKSKGFPTAYLYLAITTGLYAIAYVIKIVSSAKQA